MLPRLLPAALLMGQLPLAALAMPVARRSAAMAEWTLRGFHWNCSADESLCIYAFSLAEESSHGASPETPAFCHFAVRAKDSEPAYKSGFADVPCENLSQYRITSTWGDNGYMVLSVENIDKKRRAYFDFDVSELEDSEMASTHQSVAYAVTASSLPDYTDEDSDNGSDDLGFSPVLPSPSGDYDAVLASLEELPTTDGNDGLEALAALDIPDTPNDSDENSYEDDNGDANNYSDYGDSGDYTDGPVIEMAGVDATEEAADETSHSSDANINTVVDEPTEEDSPVADGEASEVVLEAAYTGDDTDDNFGDELDADDTDEPVEMPVLATVDDLDDYYGNDDYADGDYADDAYADGDDLEAEVLESPEDAIAELADTFAYTPGSESGHEADGSDEADDSSDYEDYTTVLSVPTIPVLWSMRNISRNFEYDPNAVVMRFVIDVLPDGPKSIPCSLHVDLDKNIDPMFASWFVQQCEDSGWFLSWGYNQMTESAVVTLINPERSEEAWFGWNSVNSNLPDTMLNSVGPGVVQTCAC